MPNRKRVSRGRFTASALFDTVRDRPVTSAAVAAGAAGVAAAGAFLWTRRDRIGEAFNSGLVRLNQLKAERLDALHSQSEIAEEALTLKETGKRGKGLRGRFAQQDLRAGNAR